MNYLNIRLSDCNHFYLIAIIFFSLFCGIHFPALAAVQSSSGLPANSSWIDESSLAVIMHGRDQAAFEKGLREHGDHMLGVQVCINGISTPLLHYLVCYAQGRYSLVKKAVKMGFDVNVSQEDTGKTPLMIAVEKSNIDMMRLLLKYGADAHMKRKDGISAIDIARANKGKSIYIPLLEGKQTIQDFLSNATAYRSLFDVVKYGKVLLLKKYLDDKSLPLEVSLALSKKRDHLGNGIKKPFNINEQDEFGNTLLSYASDQWTAYYLLRNGACTHLKNKEGRSVLDELSHRRKQREEGVAGVIQVVKNFIKVFVFRGRLPKVNALILIQKYAVGLD